jgi:hypothetical protein
MMPVTSFSLLNWQEDPPRRGRPMTDDRSTGNASVYHILSRFLPFTGTIADTQIYLLAKLLLGISGSSLWICLVQDFRLGPAMFLDSFSQDK